MTIGRCTSKCGHCRFAPPLRRTLINSPWNERRMGFTVKDVNCIRLLFCVFGEQASKRVSARVWCVRSKKSICSVGEDWIMKRTRLYHQAAIIHAERLLQECGQIDRCTLHARDVSSKRSPCEINTSILWAKWNAAVGKMKIEIK